LTVLWVAFLVVFLVETLFRPSERALCRRDGYSVEDYAAEVEPDEGGGVLLSELLETTQADLDSIEAELGRLRNELRDDDEPQV
jgi:hypothetical protein